MQFLVQEYGIIVNGVVNDYFREAKFNNLDEAVAYYDSTSVPDGRVRTIVYNDDTGNGFSTYQHSVQKNDISAITKTELESDFMVVSSSSSYEFSSFTSSSSQSSSMEFSGFSSSSSLSTSESSSFVLSSLSSSSSSTEVSLTSSSSESTKSSSSSSTQSGVSSSSSSSSSSLELSGFSSSSSSSVEQEDVIWESLVNVTTDVGAPNTLEKTSGTDGVFDAGANTAQRLYAGSGYIEFTINSVTGAISVGMANNKPDNNFTTTYSDFNFYQDGVRFIVSEFGTKVFNSSNALSVNDVLRIEVGSDEVVRYKHNGNVLYTSSLPVTYPLQGNAALAESNVNIKLAVLHGDWS